MVVSTPEWPCLIRGYPFYQMLSVCSYNYVISLCWHLGTFVINQAVVFCSGWRYLYTFYYITFYSITTLFSFFIVYNILYCKKYVCCITLCFIRRMYCFPLYSLNYIKLYYIIFHYVMLCYWYHIILYICHIQKIHPLTHPFHEAMSVPTVSWHGVKWANSILPCNYCSRL